MSILLAALINGFVVSLPLAAVVWVALGVSRRWVNAATRYAIWWILLAVVICMPFRYLPSRPSAHHAPITVERSAPPATVTARSASVFSGASRVMRTDTPRFPLRVAPGPWSAWIMAAWAVVAMIMLLRLIVSYALLARMKRQAFDAPEAVAAAARSALDRLGVTRCVRIAVVNDAVSPMVAGPFRPTILLPAVMLTSMQDAEIEQICLHEAAHFARRDDWVLMVQRLIEVLFAAHPLVRWIAAQINLEREIACDDLVISVTGSARPYAACLTRVAEMAGGFSSTSAAAAVSDERSHLTRRVETLLDKTRHAGTRLLGGRLAILACGLAIVTFLAARTTPGVVAFAAAPRTIVARPAIPVVPAVAQATPPPAPTPAPVPAQKVHVAVSVTDPMNRFVTGLDASAFRVFENGVEQKIVDFKPQKQPLSLAIVWDERGELRELRTKLAQLRTIYTVSHPDVITVEAQIAEIENRAPPAVDVPGSKVSVIDVGESQSLADGLQSALDQLQGTPAEQAAIMLLTGPASWVDERVSARVFALVRGAGVPVYPLEIGNQRPGGLAAFVSQLASEYIIGYLPSLPAESINSRNVDIRLTAPIGLPRLTVHLSRGYYYDPRDRR